MANEHAGNKSVSDEPKTVTHIHKHFGSDAGEGVGCGCMFIGLAIAFALIGWTVQGFPAFWK